MTKNPNYHNYRVNGKFAKKPLNENQCVCNCQCNKLNDKLENHLVLVVDKSGSMQTLSNKVVQFVNNWIDTNKLAALQYNQDTYVTLIEYSNTVRVIFNNIPIQDCQKYNNFRCDGMTALFDAQSLAIQTILPKEKESLNKNISFMVNHITDGYENASYIRPTSVVDLMRKMVNNGNWTFTFLVPPGNKNMFVNNYNIEPGNVQEWELSEQGLYKAQEETTSGLFNYYESRSIGKSAVRNFYDVKVDLSNIHNLAKLAKSNGLQDLSNLYTKFAVTREEEIRDYVENDLRKKYVKGNCFYQLTKEETVQPNKEILVMEKGNNKIYGGTEARELIGLIKNSYAKVDPYNLTFYKVFIQSTSVNRKLVRGTEILIKN